MLDLKCKKNHQIDPSTGQCSEGHPAKQPRLGDPNLRIGFLDIETTDFSATFGYALGYFIKVRGKEQYYSSYVKKENLEWVRARFESGKLKKDDKVDKRMLLDFARDIKNFDIVITYNGDRFDIPYLRTRCLTNGIPFPFNGTVWHWDMFVVARHKLRCGKYPSMEKVAEVLHIPGKNHVDMAIWLLAQTGSEKALDYIKDHNKRDVVVLEKTFDRLEGQWRKSRRSI